MAAEKIIEHICKMTLTHIGTHGHTHTCVDKVTNIELEEVAEEEVDATKS